MDTHQKPKHFLDINEFDLTTLRSILDKAVELKKIVLIIQVEIILN